MRDLIKIVIPKINVEWKCVAYFMDYDINDVGRIEKDSSGVKECCQKLFEDWLSTPKGATPKSWGTLLKCIRDVEELSAAAEKIDIELKAKL